MSTENMEFCLKMSPCKCGTGGGGAKLPDLSYEEQEAGFNNVDGKKVYVKTVDMGYLTNEKHIPHGIDNLHEVVEIASRFHSPTPVYCGTGYTDTYQYSFHCGQETVNFFSNFPKASIEKHKGSVTLFYTRTDR